MLNIDQVAMLSGDFKPALGANYKASYWHIPHGYDILNARVVTVYFSDEIARDCFVSEWSDTEHMAVKEE